MDGTTTTLHQTDLQNRYIPNGFTLYINSYPISPKKNRQNETTTKEWDEMGWTEERNSDFNKIKQELTPLPCLTHYNGNKENIVTTAACKTRLGVALWQKQRNREQKPIAFASRYLNDADKNSIGDLEVLAVVWGLERFRFYSYKNKSNYSQTTMHSNRD